MEGMMKMTSKKSKRSKKKPVEMGPMPYTPPSPKQQIKMAAEHVARTALDHHPKMQRMHNEITRSVMGAVGKHLGQGQVKSPDA